MFQFSFDPEDQLVQETASSFAREILRPASRTHERNGVPVELFRQYQELGFASMELSPSLEGSGQGLLAKVVVLEELAWGDPGATLALENLSWLQPALATMPEQQARAIVDEFQARPHTRVAFADGRDLGMDIQAGRVSGHLPFVPAHRPAWLLLRIATGLFLVKGEAFETEPVPGAGVEAAGGAKLTLHGAHPYWGTSDLTEAERLWSRTRIALAAMFVGVARAAHEYAVEYTRTRNVFGRPIAQHQGPAFLLADMRTAIEAARLATWYAAKAYDSGTSDAPRWAAHAFLEGAECALACTRDAVQLLGGHGFLRDHLVEKWMRDARVLTLLCGGRDSASEDLLRWKDGELQLASANPEAERKEAQT